MRSDREDHALRSLESGLDELERLIEKPASSELATWIAAQRGRVAEALAAASTQKIVAEPLSTPALIAPPEETEPIPAALASLMGLTRAQRGFIAVREGGNSLSFPFACTSASFDIAVPEDQVSLSIIEAALEGQTSVVVLNALDDARFSKKQSVNKLGLRAVLAVPLLAADRPFGVLYLDNPIRAGAFSDDARVVAEHIATILAPMVDRELTFRKVDKRHAGRAARIRESGRFSSIIGDSEIMLDVLDIVSHIAPTDAAVLVTGETGTGKDLIARCVHDCSRRREKPFIPVNCSALTPSLVESELFGHERGAFTGAHATRVGHFEAADGGTIFLDEVGELPLATQAKLLRVLQDGSFQRVGASETRRTNVRTISATNRDLEADVRDGRFREDLLYRLSVIPLAVPPLREREGDIGRLAAHFVKRTCDQNQRGELPIHPAALAILEAHTWPGNVRELSNVIERAVILTRGAEIVVDAFRAIAPKVTMQDSAEGLRSAMRAYKRRLVKRALDSHAGDHGAAAKSLGVNAKYLYQLIREVELEPPPKPRAVRKT